MALDSKALGARIAHLRELKGLSLGSLAEQADGIAKSYLAKLERGEVENPGLRTVSAIARALEVTAGELLIDPTRVRSDEGRALLSDEARMAAIMRTLPPGLREFLKEMADKNEPVPAKTIESLASAQFRGRRPERSEDWRFLYDAIRRSVRPAKPT